MKFIILAAGIAASALFGAVASAQEIKVPTGYQVAGCTWFEVKDGGKVVQLCSTDKAEDAIKAQVDPSNPRAWIKGNGSNGTSASGE